MEDLDLLAAAPVATVCALPRESAKPLVTALAKSVHSRRSKTLSGKVRKPPSRNVELAIGALVADLLSSRFGQGWVRVAVNRSSFTRRLVTFDAFEKVTQSFVRRGLIETRYGIIASTDPRTNHVSSRRSVYLAVRATPGLFVVCEKFGLTSSNVERYFDFRAGSAAIQVQEDKGAGIFKDRGVERAFTGDPKSA